MKKVLILPGDSDGCAYHRAIIPYSKIKHDQIDFEVVDTEWLDTILAQSVVYGFLSRADAIVCPPVGNKPFLEMIRTLKAKKPKLKVYIDIDDNYFQINQTSAKAYDFWIRQANFKVLTEACKIVDGLFHSTPELKRPYWQFNTNQTVFPNAIDLDKYPQSRRAELPSDRVVVMWTGGVQHHNCLKEVNQVFTEVINSEPNALFVLACDKVYLPYFKGIDPDKLIHMEPVPFEDYYPIPSLCDIGTTPVELSTFNEGKSELKCLEHGVWGVPVISTEIAPYTRFHKNSNGANLLVPKNRERDWKNKLTSLIRNESLRKELGEKSRLAVETCYNLDVINQQRIEFFERELCIPSENSTLHLSIT